MIRVRLAKRSDLDEILVMARRLAASVADPEPRISRSSLEGALFGPRRWGECIVAADAQGIAGYAIASRYFEAHTGKRQMRIADLFVRENARGSGVGRLIFAEIVNRARRLHCSEVAWEVWRENESAYRFYERLGAQHAGDVSTMRFAI